jgi:hypothetical protein
MLFFDRSSEAYNGDEVANLYVWDFQSASNNIRYNTTAVATSDVAQGDIASVSVTDGVVKFYKNNVLAHTFTQNMSLDSKDYVVGLSAHSTSSGGQVCLNFGQDSSHLLDTKMITLTHNLMLTAKVISIMLRPPTIWRFARTTLMTLLLLCRVSILIRNFIQAQLLN